MGFEEGLNILLKNMVPDEVKPIEDKFWIDVSTALGVRLPINLDGCQDAKDVKEIYEYFKSEKPDDPMFSFIEHTSKLPVITNGETRLNQVLRSVRFKQLAKYHREQAEKYEKA